MAAVANRWVLGILSALAILGGSALVLMTIVYFEFNDYWALLSEYGEWGILAGTCALGVFIGSAFRAPLLARIGAGLVSVGVGYFASLVLALLVSLSAAPGGYRGNLETGAAGFIWLAACAYFMWSMGSRRWPVDQERAADEEARDLGRT